MAIQGEHPIARWLDMTLPQLVNQHITNRDNRIHEKDMMRERQKQEETMMRLNNDLQSKRELNRWQIDQGTKAYEAKVKEIKEKQDILQAFNIDATLISGLDQTQQTDAGAALVKGLGEDFSRPLIQDIEAKSTLELQLGELQNQNAYLNETDAILNRLMTGAMEGKRVAGLVGDLDPTGIEGQINEADFLKYLELMENPFEEGSPEHSAFMASVPSHEEGLKLGEQYWDTINKQATAQSNIVKGQGLTGANYQRFNDVFDIGSQSFELIKGMKLDKGYLDAIQIDPSKLEFKKETLEKSPHFVYDAMDNLASGIIKAIEYADSTDLADQFVTDYKAAESHEDKRKVMGRLIKAMREDGSQTHLALEAMFGKDSGGADNPHQVHFNAMLDFYDKILTEEQLAGVLSGKYSIDVLNKETKTAQEVNTEKQEGDPSINVPTEEVEQLNQDLANAPTDSSQGRIAVNSALEIASQYEDAEEGYLMAQDHIYSLINNGMLSDKAAEGALKELEEQRSSRIIASTGRMGPMWDFLGDVGDAIGTGLEYAFQKPYERPGFRKNTASGELDELQENLLANTK